MLGTSIGTSIAESGAQSGGVTQPKTPNTPQQPPSGGGQSAREKYRDLGYAIRKANRLSDITEDNTCYLVDGALEMDGFHELHDIKNIAVVGTSDDARLVIPENYRQYALIVRSGEGFVWSGVDIDQRKPDAMGRMYVAVSDGAVFQHGKHIGSGAPENPHPDERAIRSGAIFYLPATAESGVNTVRDWEIVFEGTFPDIHYGNRAMGFWSGPQHRGTIRVLDSYFESIPNNSIYGAASSGSYEVENCTFRDNGVTCGGRFAHGEWRGCDIEFDFSETTLGNPRTDGHAVVGIAAEQKKEGANGDPGPDVIDCNIRMVNSPKGGAGIRAYDIYQPSKLGRIVDTEVHIGEDTGGYDADIEVEGPAEEIRNCTFSGSNPRYASIVNTSGTHVTMQNCDWDYPSSRKRDKGDVEWA